MPATRTSISKGASAVWGIQLRAMPNHSHIVSRGARNGYGFWSAAKEMRKLGFWLKRISSVMVTAREEWKA
jgi:hypothetical protein